MFTKTIVGFASLPGAKNTSTPKWGNVNVWFIGSWLWTCRRRTSPGSTVIVGFGAELVEARCQFVPNAITTKWTSTAAAGGAMGAANRRTPTIIAGTTTRAIIIGSYITHHTFHFLPRHGATPRYPYT